MDALLDAAALGLEFFVVSLGGDVGATLTFRGQDRLAACGKTLEKLNTPKRTF